MLGIGAGLVFGFGGGKPNGTHTGKTYTVEITANVQDVE